MAFFLKELTGGNCDPTLKASFEADRTQISHCSLFTHFPNICVTATAKKGFIQLVNMDSGAFQTFLTHLDGVILPLEAPLRFVTLSPALYLAHQECHHIFYALAHGSELLCANFNTGTVSVIANFSARPSAIYADGEYVICGTSDGEVHCWRATTLLYEGATLRTRPQGVANMSIERSLMMMSGGVGGSGDNTNPNQPFNYFHNGDANDSYGLSTPPNNQGDVYPTMFVNDSGSILWRHKTGRAGINSLQAVRDFIVIAADDFSVSVRSISNHGEVVAQLAHPSVRVKGIAGIGLLPTIRLCVASERGGLTVYENISSSDPKKPIITVGSDPFGHIPKGESLPQLTFNIVGSQYISAPSSGAASGRTMSCMSHANQFLVVGTENGNVILFDTQADNNVTNVSRKTSPLFRELVSFDVHHKVISAEILKNDCLVVVTSNGDVWRWPMVDVIKAIPARGEDELGGEVEADAPLPTTVNASVADYTSTQRPVGLANNANTSRLFFNESTASDMVPPAPRSDPSPQPNSLMANKSALFAFDEDALYTHNSLHQASEAAKNAHPAGNFNSAPSATDRSVADTAAERMTITSIGGISKITGNNHFDENGMMGADDEDEAKRFPTRMSTTASARAVSVAALSEGPQPSMKNSGQPQTQSLHYDPSNYAAENSLIDDGATKGKRRQETDAFVDMDARKNLNQSHHPSSTTGNFMNTNDPADEALQFYESELKQERTNKKITVTIKGLKEGKRMDPRRVQYGLDVAKAISSGKGEEGHSEEEDQPKSSLFNRPSGLNPYYDEGQVESEMSPLDAAAAEYAAKNPTVFNALKLKHSVKGAKYSLHEPVYAAHPALSSQHQHLLTDRNEEDEYRIISSGELVVEEAGEGYHNTSLPSDMQGSQSGFANNANRMGMGSSPIGSSARGGKKSLSPLRRGDATLPPLPSSAGQVQKVDDLIDATFSKYARKRDERFEKERSMPGPDINKHGCSDLLFATLLNKKLSSVGKKQQVSGSALLSDRTKSASQQLNTRGAGKNIDPSHHTIVEDEEEGEVINGGVMAPRVNTIFFGGAMNADSATEENTMLFGKGPFDDYFIQRMPVAP